MQNYTLSSVCLSRCFFILSVSLSFSEVTSGLSTAGSSCHRELHVINFDLEVEGVEREMQATLQWIAASELGIPALSYRKKLQHTHTKVTMALSKIYKVAF